MGSREASVCHPARAVNVMRGAAGEALYKADGAGFAALRIVVNLYCQTTYQIYDGIKIFFGE